MIEVSVSVCVLNSVVFNPGSSGCKLSAVP